MINITECSNGFRVATDYMSDVETVTVSLAVGIGSRFEDERTHGVSHFLEHMAFKGTHKRTALQIAQEVDMIGGVMNAYTSKEKTVYYIKVLKDDLRLAIDILADIIQNSTFLSDEIERERGVILQELASCEDTPDDIVFDYFFDLAYQNQPIGRPILGTRDTISSFSKSDFVGYVSQKYHAGNMCLSVAGNARHDTVLGYCNEFFTSLNAKKDVKSEDTKYSGGELRKNNQDLQQVQYLIGYECCSVHSDDWYTLQIANSILGGGMSSRLFQEIREKLGLVYTISSFANCFSDTGIFGIYAGVSAEKVDELHAAVGRELKKIVDSIDDIELVKTINQFKAGILMSSESTTSRSQKLASNLLNFNRYIPTDEILDGIKKVTKSDIQRYVDSLTSGKQTFVLYGNI